MTRTAMVTLCGAVAREIERVNTPVIDFADGAYSRAFFGTDSHADTCIEVATSAFVLAVVLAAAGWPT